MGGERRVKTFASWSQLDGTEDKMGNSMEIKAWEKMECIMDKLEESHEGLEESEQTWAHCFDTALEGHDLVKRHFGYSELCALIKSRCEGAAMRLRDNGKPEKGLAFMQQKDGKKVRCDHCQEEGH